METETKTAAAAAKEKEGKSDKDSRRGEVKDRRRRIFSSSASAASRPCQRKNIPAGVDKETLREFPTCPQKGKRGGNLLNVFHFRSSGSAGNNVMSDTRNKISLFEKAAREQRAEAPERQRQVRNGFFKKDTLGKLSVFHLQRAKFEARKSKFEQPQEQQQQEQQGKKQQNGG